MGSVCSSNKFWYFKNKIFGNTNIFRDYIKFHDRFYRRKCQFWRCQQFSSKNKQYGLIIKINTVFYTKSRRGARFEWLYVKLLSIVRNAREKQQHSNCSSTFQIENKFEYELHWISSRWHNSWNAKFNFQLESHQAYTILDSLF